MTTVKLGNHPARTSATRISLLVLPALLAVAGANVWMALHRFEGYNYHKVGYPTIYYPSELPSLSDGQLRTFEASYREGGKPKFYSSSLLVGPFKQYGLDELTPSVKDYPPADVAAARAILEPSGIFEEETTEERVLALWRALDSRLGDRKGTPPPDLRTLPAMEQYRRAVSGDAEIHCTNLAEIFTFFATVGGIPTRVVDVNHVVDRVTLSNHTFTEVFVSEAGRWAYVDLQLGLVFVRDAAGGAFMNAVQLAQLHEADALGGLTATVFADGVFRDLPYRDHGGFSRFLLNPNATFVFHRFYEARHSLGAWLHRYLIEPELAYSAHGGEWCHWLKLSGFYAAIVLAAVWIFATLRAIIRPTHGKSRTSEAHVYAAALGRAAQRHRLRRGQQLAW